MAAVTRLSPSTTRYSLRLRASTESATTGGVSRSARSNACDRGIWKGRDPREQLLFQHARFVRPDRFPQRIGDRSF